MFQEENIWVLVHQIPKYQVHMPDGCPLMIAAV